VNRRWAILVLIVAFALVLSLPFVGAYLRGQTHDCPPTLHVANASSEEVDEAPVQFTRLSEQRQREFERAVGGDRPEVESTVSAWVATRFVYYRGANYSTAVAVC
jgi:hypothetical protein